MRFFALFLLSPSLWASDLLINGAGATFPYPLYSKWFYEYYKQHPDTKINYQSIGSGGGIGQLQRKTVDFGASDVFMTPEEIGRNPAKVLHLPTVAGAVVITYNLPFLKQPLKLSQQAVLGLFSGEIKSWRDERIQKTNPDMNAPEQVPVILVTRSDGSGTTAAFTEFLSNLDAEFARRIGKGKVARWPSGVSGKGNEGVTGFVQQNAGAIGYVEMVYAHENKLPMAAVENAEGVFVEPSVRAVTAAAEAIKTIPPDLNVSITNAPGRESYPLASLTYLLVYEKMKPHKGEKFLKFLDWAYGPGQAMAEKLSYAPLPPKLLSQVQAKVKTIRLE